MQLVIELSSNRSNCGTLMLCSKGCGRTYGPFPVAARATDCLAAAAGNPERNPLLRYGDTPTGGYVVRQLLKSGRGTRFPTAQFGANGVIVLEPVSGDAACAEANGRFHLLISGGGISADGLLHSTAGGLRLRNNHLRILFSALRKNPDVLVTISEHEDRCDSGTVFVDPSCTHQDPQPLQAGQQAWKSRNRARDVMRGGMAGAMVFGFSVSFVSLQAPAPAEAFAPAIEHSSRSLRDFGKAQLPSVATPARSYTKLAYNTSSQLIDSEMANAIEGAPPPEPQTFATQMSEVWADAKKNTLSELGEKSVDVLEKVTEKMGEAEEAANFKSATSILSEAEMEFHVSNYTIASSALKGVGTALAVKSAFEKGTLIGNAINDLNDGKMTVSEFAQKVGPEPAKLLLSSVGVPFSDQVVDAGVATLNEGVSRAIDAGFDLYDRYKGYQGPPKRSK